MKEADGFVEKALSDITALPEQGMRLDYLCKTLLGMGGEDAAYFLDSVCRKDPSSHLAKKAKSLLIDSARIKDILGKEACAQIRNASKRLGLKRVERLFSEPRPHKTGIAGYDKEEEIKMEHLSLGQRRSLSKTGVKDSIDRLLSDPDPLVIRNVLNNPRVTEKEVLKIASKRPNSPEILRMLSCHRVWSKRYAVIKAVASNPYAEPRTSVALLELLLSQDLKGFSRDRTLHPNVRQAAKEILEERDSKG
jgi:hypothetical protein